MLVITRVSNYLLLSHIWLCLRSSLPFLTELVQQMKPTNCPLDIVLAKILKEAFTGVGSGLLVLFKIEIEKYFILPLVGEIQKTI